LTKKNLSSAKEKAKSNILCPECENVTHRKPSSRMKNHWESVVELVAGQPTASPKDMRRQQQPLSTLVYTTLPRQA